MSRVSSIRMDTAKAEKIMKQRRSVETIKTLRCSGEKLRKKGVLLAIDGIDTVKQ